MNIPRFLSIIALAWVAATPAFAQSATPEPVQSVSGTPERTVDEFFSQLESGRVDTAYDQLLKGTKIADSPKDVAMLKNKTREAIHAFGDIMGQDRVGTKTVGTRLMRVTCLSLGRQFPIRWRFYFYKGADKWTLIDIRLDDRLNDMFEEPMPVIAPSPASSAK
ncbi:MAG: hypothetical protein WCP06_08520 [Verrucomicrobiota bacterium]